MTQTEEAKPVISIEDLDENFKFEVAGQHGAEALKACFACGTCTAGCPVREIDARFNPRKIIRMVLLGMRKEVLSSDFIWLCSSCYTCQERCPQKVKITDIMTVLRNMAVKEGYVSHTIVKQLESLSEFGRIYEISDFDNKKRKKFGLAPLQKAAEGVNKILAGYDLDKLMKKE